MYTVVENKGGMVMVDARKLFRVVIMPEDEIAEELVTADEATEYVDYFNGCNPRRRHWAEAHRYTAILSFIWAAIATNSPIVLSV